ncbi:hypothetical protein B0H65DRAFT_506757 [Neurospora tetraspora]|uniref:Uncharacterized protein n=1 Tax=Neurospora tetraspora TaxID=94610 RepID=A0AAE0JKI1_9PEZI|nr:hypothetical protein B0H65DRAFT_506757 [Neurospora tetraspora]
MPKQEVYHLHSFGWENDPEEEKLKLSTLDYISLSTYNNYCLFFRLDDALKPRAVQVLKERLERTLSQARYLVGRIERDPEGGHHILRKRDDTVEFHVQWLDAPEDAAKYPSIDDMERTHFSTVTLGDLKQWSVLPMTFGESPEAHIENHPTVSAFKMNFVRGGMLFHMHHHHFAADVMAWYGYARQIAENCHAIFNGTPFPSWDPAALDLSRLCKPQPSPEAMITVPPRVQRHPAHTKGVSLLFHLPKSKAAKLKNLCAPADGLVPFISTYDCVNAFIYRTLTRLRAPVYNYPSDTKLFWGETIDMRRRLQNPKPAPRVRGNVMFCALSTNSAWASEWSLSRLATYIRQMTDSVTPEALDTALEMVNIVSNKADLGLSVDGTPPMSIMTTDHRDCHFGDVSFGFGTPLAYRLLADWIMNGLVLFYPPRDLSPESDEGVEFIVYYEKTLVKALIEDPEWCEFMEYRGVEAEDSVVREGDDEEDGEVVEKVMVAGDKKGWMETVTVEEVPPTPIA